MVAHLPEIEQAALSFSLEGAGIRDLFPVRHLEKECFGEDAWSLLELAGVLAFSAGTRLKAVTDGRLVGFIAGDWEFGHKIGWVTTVAVMIKYQRRGIAAALLGACEKVLSVPIMRLCVRISNIPAITLYQHYGYKQVDIRRRYYSDGEDAFVFEKRIAV
ncbi:MAG: GNAT family N-acetyltransferase [Anaerolineaceae bacterium]